MGVLQLFSALFGLALLGMGIAGYMPNYFSDGLLFGTFEVNDMQAIIYIVVGAISLIASLSRATTRFCFKIFGLLFGMIAVMGFASSGDLYIFHVNMADNVFHLTLAVIALYFGFLHSSSSSL